MHSNHTHTTSFNRLGEPMTPRLTNLERERREFSAGCRRRHSVRSSRRVANHEQESIKRKLDTILTVIGVIALLVIITVMVSWAVAQDAAVEQILSKPATAEETILLSDGEGSYHEVNASDYEQALKEARQAELEQLGLAG